MAHTFIAKSLDMNEIVHFEIDDVKRVYPDDGVFYIGITPCGIDSVKCLEVDDLQAQITDLIALAESNHATIDRLLAEVKALRELADTQAAIIAAKNAEIAEMRDDYAGALVNDDEAGMMLAAGAGA